MREIVLLLIFLCKLINCESDSDTTEKCDKLASFQCDESVMTNYLAEIEVTCPENLIEQTAINFETYCRRIYEQLEKFHRYTGACKVTKGQNLYTFLTAGVRTLHKKLCPTSDYLRRKGFQLYYPCLHELRKDFDSCSGPVDWYEDKDETQVCKNYKHIVDCYYIKTAKVCGIDAAKTLKELVVEVFDSTLQTKCDVSEDPDVKDPMPESYLCGKAETVNTPTNVLIFFTFLRLYLI